MSRIVLGNPLDLESPVEANALEGRQTSVEKRHRLFMLLCLAISIFCAIASVAGASLAWIGALRFLVC